MQTRSSLLISTLPSQHGCEKKAVGCARWAVQQIATLSCRILRCNLACDIFILSARSHARANGRAPIKKTNYNWRQLKQFEIRVHTRVSGRAQHHLSRASRTAAAHRFGLGRAADEGAEDRAFHICIMSLETKMPQLGCVILTLIANPTCVAPSAALAHFDDVRVISFRAENSSQRILFSHSEL